MRKILTGAMVLATAAVVSVAGSASASAADLTTSTVKVDAVNQTLTVEGSDCKEVGFSVASVNAKTGIIKPAADAAWEWHDGKKVTIDLSTLSNTKDNYVQLKTDTGEEMTIKIPAVNTKVKAVYDAAANTVAVQDVTDSKAPVAVTGKVEFKNKYGSWAEYTAAALESYVYKGAALTFRVAADADTAIAAAGEKDAVIKKAATDEAGIVYYVAKAFPGKEVKVSVKKLANGPKVAANYVKNTITVPKGAEYRITSAGDTALGTWTDLKDITKAEALDAATVAAKVGTIEVRTKAVAAEGTKAGKPASKISRLSFGAVEQLAWGNTDSAVADFTADKKVKGDIKFAYVGTEASKAITVEYVTTTNKKTGVTSTTGIKITNNSTDAYQVYVNKAADGAAPAIGVKGAVAVGAATVKGETVTAKEVTIKNCDKAQIFVTKVGNAKTATWASPFVGIGTVAYPADVVPEPDPTVAPTEAPAE
ncbi:MAG: hypothetical protein K2K70_12940 [Lachnospiraceae bacterium]|nr:hypothetical protein [Lachnospiraceae bacterium]